MLHCKKIFKLLCLAHGFKFYNNTTLPKKPYGYIERKI